MDDVEAFARARKRKLRVRLLLLAAVVAAPFAYLGWKIHATNAANEEHAAARRKALELSEPERAALRDSIAEARKLLAAAREGWARAVTPEALAAASPGAAPCRIRLVAPTSEAADSYARHGSIDANYFGNVFFRSYRAGEPLAPQDIDAALKELDRTAAELGAGTADRDDAARVDDLEGRSLFVVVERETEPVVTATVVSGSFVPGRLVGTAYVYSYRERRITCAGALDVQNRESIEFDFSYMADNFLDKEAKMREAAKATLQRDLTVRVQQAIVRGLRAVDATAPAADETTAPAAAP